MTDAEDRTARIRAEAAAWFARLDSDEHEPADKAGFRQWLAEDQAHVDAFARIAASWQRAGAAAQEIAANGTPRAPHGRGTRRQWLAAASVALVALGTAWWRLHAPDHFETAIGEQRRIMLADGSEVLLDTASRLSVRLGDAERALTLQRGRAHFTVAHDRARPFRVSAGDRVVTALGTAFDVALRPQHTEVLLLSGRVTVEGAGHRQLLAPGERLVFTATAQGPVDRPDLTRLTAWQQGRVVFASTPLTEAAAEFNRYARRPIHIADAAAGRLRISGVYSVRDIDGFVDALTRTLPVQVAHDADAITITTP